MSKLTPQQLAQRNLTEVANALATLRQHIPDQPQAGHIVWHWDLGVIEFTPTDAPREFHTINLETGRQSFTGFYPFYSPDSPWVYLAANLIEYTELLQTGRTAEYQRGYEDGYDTATSEEMPDPNTNLLELLQRTAHYPTVPAAHKEQ